MYYLRSTAAADAIKFTLDKNALQQPTEATVPTAVAQPVVVEAQKSLDYEARVADYEQKKSDMACSLDNPDACEACGS
jgi:ribonucleoside-diphosphate reductase alpha chain